MATKKKAAAPRYRVLTQPVYYTTDPAVLRRLKSGEKLPWHQVGTKVAKVGDIVDDLPPGPNIDKMLAAGIIELVEEAD